MGCEQCADSSAEPKEQRFQILVSLMLSSQTKDGVTHAACARIKAALAAEPGGFCAAAVAKLQAPALEQLLYPVSFYKTKALHVLAAAQHCAEKLGGDIPDSVEALCELKGVGPKMAFLAMSSGERDGTATASVCVCASLSAAPPLSLALTPSLATLLSSFPPTNPPAWMKNVGIGVDTHVHRISNRLGWVKTESPQHTQVHLQSWLPREDWDSLNLLFVGFGQMLCTPTAPKCDTCSAKALCPTGSGSAASLRAAAAAAAAEPGEGRGEEPPAPSVA
jgi:endonuclease-3